GLCGMACVVWLVWYGLCGMACVAQVLTGAPQRLQFLFLDSMDLAFLSIGPSYVAVDCPSEHIRFVH
ncbi:MAG: hypothetical protein MPK62_00200, partial [Alphaproteobacteria bacterium]|nr:hypothetical protein [Alphaproteobacteria bacterium]